MFTTRGSYQYRGRNKAMDAMINLLVCLKVSGARLQDFSAMDGGGLFVESGILSFVVEGSEDEVQKFRTAFNG